MNQNSINNKQTTSANNKETDIKMKKNEFVEKLKRGMEKLEIQITENQAEQFYKYMNLLIEWNKKINLTAITDPNEIILKHFIDSATIYKYTKNAQTLIDIGTGAGFPGIPIKILQPQTQITLLDSLNKRINFLNEIIKELNLKKIISIHERAEQASRNKQHRENYEIVVSRAVANMTTLSEYTIPFIKQNGKAIYMKGSEIDEEIEKSKYAIKTLGGEIEKIEKFTLPETDIKRTNIIIHKKSTTSGKYPRNSAQIKNNPLIKN